MRRPLPTWSFSLLTALSLVLVSAGCKRGTEAPPDAVGETTGGDAPAAPSTKPKAGQPYNNSLGQKFIPVPGMPVLMSVWETRRSEFAAYLQSVNASAAVTLAQKPSHPINNVSWHDATDFCRWLTEKERSAGRIGAQDRYRLPTSAEWTAAIGPDRYPWGKKWPTIDQRPTLGGYLPDAENNFGPVGSKPANTNGFHDLGGNLFEWGEDWYHAKLNNSELRLEFKRLETDMGGKKLKFLRGAAWVTFDPLNLQAGYHYPNFPDARGGLYGFRAVLAFDSAEPLPAARPAMGWKESPALTKLGKEGRDVFSGRCSECHQLFDPAGYPDDEWDSWLNKMVPKAKLKANETTALNEFLRTIRTRN